MLAINSMSLLNFLESFGLARIVLFVLNFVEIDHDDDRARFVSKRNDVMFVKIVLTTSKSRGIFTDATRGRSFLFISIKDLDGQSRDG